MMEAPRNEKGTRQKKLLNPAQNRLRDCYQLFCGLTLLRDGGVCPEKIGGNNIVGTLFAAWFES
jgi:hypothetical protein